MPVTTTTTTTTTAETLESPPRQEYFESLMVPSQEVLDRIAAIQESREIQHRRKSSTSTNTSTNTSTSTFTSSRSHRPSSSSNSKLTPAAVPNPQQGIGALLAASTATAGLGLASSSSSLELCHRRARKTSLSQRLSDRFSGLSLGDLARVSAAAILIQRQYRGYRTRRQLHGLVLDANTRWIHAIRDAQYREQTRPRSRAMSEEASLSSPMQNWRKAALIVKRASVDQDTDVDSDEEAFSSLASTSTSTSTSSSSSSDTETDKKPNAQPRSMGLPYFLEMVDLKHRYGANLRVYHETWQRADTRENFFYWLDHGDGQTVDLATCPRDRLDREQVRYLSREERRHYLVQVDHEGRLTWAKNGQRIDTSVAYRDSLCGVVPQDDPAPSFQPRGDHVEDEDVDEEELEAARAAKYSLSARNGEKNSNKNSKKTRLATARLGDDDVDSLLRKSVQKNTWIFVADTHGRLYVGIKDSGTFQHSSFLQGARIQAAGLIRIRKGRLQALSPLSGHYRPPAANFRSFLASMRSAGVDMGQVTISKAYVVLVGLEAYGKTRKRVLKRLGKETEKENEETQLED